MENKLKKEIESFIVDYANDSNLQGYTPDYKLLFNSALELLFQTVGETNLGIVYEWYDYNALIWENK